MGKRMKWKNLFCHVKSMKIINDFFWWIFCNEFQIGKNIQESKQNKELLFDRISENFVPFFHGISNKYKGSFFSRFYDALAQVVYISFHTAYPNSKPRFDDLFKERILHVCS